MSLRAHKIKFFGEIAADGRLRLVNAKVFNHALTQFKGKPIILTLEEHHKTRTLEQNAYYWLYLQAIADHTGDDRNYLHAVFKNRFIEPTLLKTTFGEVEDYKTTTVMTKMQFSEYMEKIRVLTGVPFPNEEAGRLGYSVE